MRITKFKMKDSKCQVNYELKNDGVTDEYTMNCSARPKDSLPKALQALREHVQMMCELPESYRDKLIVKGVSWSYSGPNDTMGAVITAELTLEQSVCNLNLNTPHKTVEHYSGNPDGDGRQLLAPDCVRDLDTLVEEVKDYVRGERSQGDLFGGGEQEKAPPSKKKEYRLDKGKKAKQEAPSGPPCDGEKCQKYGHATHNEPACCWWEDDDNAIDLEQDAEGHILKHEACVKGKQEASAEKEQGVIKVETEETTAQDPAPENKIIMEDHGSAGIPVNPNNGSKPRLAGTVNKCGRTVDGDGKCSALWGKTCTVACCDECGIVDCLIKCGEAEKEVASG